MKFNEKTLVIEAREVNALLVTCIRQYLFRNKNISPEKIIIEQIDSFNFKYDQTSKAESIPVQYVTVAEKETANDSTDRQRRASRNRKVAKPISSDSKDEPKSDEQK